MLLENTQEIPLPKLFSGGLISNPYDNQSGYDKGSIFENGRVKANSNIKRKGFTKIGDIGTEASAHPTSITLIEDKLLITTVDNKIYISNSEKTLYTYVGVLNSSTTSNFQPTVSVFGNLATILNGGLFQIYNITDNTLINIPSSHYPASDWYPTMSRINLNRNYVAGDPGDLRKLYMSVPASVSNPDHIYDFHNTGFNLQLMDAPIIGIENILNGVFVFTTNGIYQISDDFVNTVQFIKIYSGVGVMNKQTVTNANNILFFLTSDRKIKTVNYIAGIPNPQVGDLSDLEGNEIQHLLNNELHENQSSAHMFFDDNQNIVFLFCRSATNNTNYADMCIGYDLIHKSWIKDTGRRKFYTALTFADGKVYTGRYGSNDLLLDNVGKTDGGETFVFKKKTKSFDFGDGSIRKVLRELRLQGKLNLATGFDINIYVDGELNKTISFNSNVVNNSVRGTKTDEDMLYDFSKFISGGNLFEKGYNYVFEFISHGDADEEFSLNGCFLKLKPLNNNQKVDLVAK